MGQELKMLEIRLNGTGVGNVINRLNWTGAENVGNKVEWDRSWKC